MSLLIRSWAIALTGYKQVWDPQPAGGNDLLLLETGDHVLLENGDFFALE